MKDKFTVKDILTAVDDILKNQPSNTNNKNQFNETPIKEILGAVDEIFKIQPIQKSEEKIIDKKPVKITKIENKNNDLEIKKNLNEKKDKKYDLMIILSGPEPQRGLLEDKLKIEIRNYKGKILFIQGIIEREQKNKQTDNVTFYNFMNSRQLEQALNESEIILCRSGYTSIMDLSKLNKKTFFIVLKL